MHPGDTAMCLTDGETRERNTELPDDFPKVLFLWFARDLLLYFGRKMLRRIEFEPFRPLLPQVPMLSMAPFWLAAPTTTRTSR
jgi:hypothetical protein